jgi:hypothetical protein
MAASKFEEWLIAGALGPAAVALPVNWAAGELAGVAARWFKRLTRTDDLSRLVRAAGASVDLSRAEFDAVRRLLQNSQTWAQIGHGTVEALAASIASACLPSRDSRTEKSRSQQRGRSPVACSSSLSPILSLNCLTSCCSRGSIGCSSTRRVS